MKRRRATAVFLVLVLSFALCSAVFAQDEQPSEVVREDGRIEFYVDGIPENTDAQIERYRSQFDGADARLYVEGEFDEALRFLKSFDFASLDLEWGFSDFFLPGEESGKSRGLAEVEHLTALTIRDSNYGYYSWTDVFPELQELTLQCEDSIQIFGCFGSRQMPNLRTLTVITPDVESFQYSCPASMFFPSTLESVVICEGEEPADPDQIFSTAMIGALQQCCPSVLVNGAALQDLPAEARSDLETPDALRLAKTDAAVLSLMDTVYYGGAQVSEDLPVIKGRLLFAVLGMYDRPYLYQKSYGPFEKQWLYYGLASPEENMAIYGEDIGVDSYTEREVPVDILADGIDDADTVILIYENDVRVADSILEDTCVIVADPKAGIIYAPYSALDPEETDAWFDADRATSQIMEAYENGSVQQAAIGRGRLSGSYSSTQASVGDDTLSAVLAALNQQTYADTLAALTEGEVITSGSNGPAAQGLQQMLVDFGCDIAVDGSAGPATFNALNSVLSAFGMDSAESVDADLYGQLLPLLLISTDQRTAESILADAYPSEGEGNRFEYLRGCAMFAAEKYYSAKEAFEYSQYGDYEERAAACVQSWPANGELYHNPSYYGQGTYLNFDVNSSDESRGMYFEVYSEGGDLVSALFLTGSGRVSTSFPGGIYRVRDGVGTEWYGLKEAFGRDGSYEYMAFYEFDSDDTLTSLDAGYEWTISINTGTGTGSGVGSHYSDWDSWSGN